MTAPKNDTQAPRIGITVGVDFATGKDTKMLTLTMGDKFEFASANSLWGQAMLDLLAERDLADARASAAAQAMREAALKAIYARKVVYQTIQERHDVWAPPCLNAWEEMDHTAEAHDYAYDAIRNLPLPDPAALDRLIAERVREAVEAEREACAQIIDARCEALFGDRLEDNPTEGQMVNCAFLIRARGSKEGQS